MKTLKHLAKSSIYFFYLLVMYHSFANPSPQFHNTPPLQRPVEVEVNVKIKKIFNINAIDESFQVDGYLAVAWKDERYKFTPQDSTTPSFIYENKQAAAIIGEKIWIPTFEFINNRGGRSIANYNIKIHPSGYIEYEERFFATFSSNMNFKRFPFDKQSYKIEIEPFSYDNRYLKIKKMRVTKLDDDEKEKLLGDSWEFKNVETKIIDNSYNTIDNNSELPTEISGDKHFDRMVVSVTAKRLTGYYIWQVMFPLFIIIISSFFIFWIKEFSTQISIAFTLMLTVVAFNFYSASILPKLPYNTFIEYVIIIGYSFIFMGILSVVINHKIHGEKEDIDTSPLFKYLKFIMPLAYFVCMGVLSIIIFS